MTAADENNLEPDFQPNTLEKDPELDETKDDHKPQILSEDKKKEDKKEEQKANSKPLSYSGLKTGSLLNPNNITKGSIKFNNNENTFIGDESKAVYVDTLRKAKYSLMAPVIK